MAPPELIEALQKRLINADTGLFDWWNADDRVDLYQSGLGWPVLTAIIDGFGMPAAWRQDIGLQKSETLFRVLKETSPSWSAVYIKHQDEAYAEIAWVRTLTGEQLHRRILEEFTRNPADEAGSSFLCLFADRVEDMVLFTYAPDRLLRISLFGRMKTAIPTALGLDTAG